MSAAVAAIGFLIAVGFYSAAGDDERAPELSKRDVQEARRIGGQINEITMEVNSFVRSLGRGRRLAYTIAGVALGLGGFGYWLAREWEEEELIRKKNPE